MAAQNPGPRVVITNYHESGKSIIGSDTISTPIRLASNNNNNDAKALEFSPFHIVQSVPVKRTEQLRKEVQNIPSIPRAPSEGLLFGSIDFPPGFRTSMHNTLSLDYGVILSGEITLVLDGGGETVLKTGDVVVQQGTSHAWFNHGVEICRMAFVAVAREDACLEAGESV